MDSEMKNGGPAFPRIEPAYGDAGGPRIYFGISARDWFATHASDEDVIDIFQKYGAITRIQARYIHADLMLAERAK